MRMWTFLVIIILILAPPQGVTGKEKGKMEQEINLPSEAAGWKWDQKDLNYNRRSIFDYIDGAGELYLAYNFRGVRVRRYEKPGQRPIIAELFDMGSSEDAYGIFSFERQDEDVGIGQGSELGGGLLRFWKGKFFVSVYAEGEGPEVESAILTLGREVAESIKMSGPAPKLISVLPDGKAGLVEKSIRYLHSHVLLNQRFFVANENILKLNQKTEAVLAQYLRDQKKVHLLLIRYPAEKEAEAALVSFKKAYMPEASEKYFLQTEDKKWTGAKRQKEVILIVFGASKEKEAEEIIDMAEKKIGAN
ncbi:MAG: DUF6599 family protein [Thermodesulfobacteriota bacterium]